MPVIPKMKPPTRWPALEWRRLNRDITPPRQLNRKCLPDRTNLPRGDQTAPMSLRNTGL
jgi:hypothetical protein